MNYILFDDASTRNNLLPLTFMRPVAEVRIGILSMRERWEKYLGTATSTLTEDYLSGRYPIVKEEQNVLVNGSVVPNPELLDRINQLRPGQALIAEDYIVAMHLSASELEQMGEADTGTCEEIETRIAHTKLDYPWEIFTFNDKILRADFDLVTRGKKSQPLSPTNRIVGEGSIFLEEGARVESAVINVEKGPVYIGKNAEVMEGCMIRGPFSLGEDSVLKMGTRIYGATTIGPGCKTGGEVNNCVFFGNSNKAHDGFLGNSVIAEWCNIGAGTNNSNLKNTYDEVRLWSYPKLGFAGTGLQFCGLIMGDHSKCGINTMFNTGTVVGVNCNIYGAGYQRNFVPSFSWGGVSGMSTYDLNKAIEVAEAVYARRSRVFDETDKQILEAVFQLSSAYRHY